LSISNNKISIHINTYVWECKSCACANKYFIENMNKKPWIIFIWVLVLFLVVIIGLHCIFWNVALVDFNRVVFGWLCFIVLFGVLFILTTLLYYLCRFVCLFLCLFSFVLVVSFLPGLFMFFDLTCTCIGTWCHRWFVHGVCKFMHSTHSNCFVLFYMYICIYCFIYMCIQYTRILKYEFESI
jgi:hypothetical protein